MATAKGTHGKGTFGTIKPDAEEKEAPEQETREAPAQETRQELEGVRAELDRLREQNKALIATYHSDIGNMDRQMMGASFDDGKMLLVQFKRAFGYAGIEGGHRRIMLAGSFTVKEGEVVYIPESVVQRLEQNETPELLTREESQFKPMVVHRRRHDPNTRQWVEEKEEVSVGDLIKRARKVGGMKVR